MAEQKKSENKLLSSGSGIFKKKQTSKTENKTAKSSSSVNNAKAETELQKTKEIQTVASASTAVKDRQAEKKLSAATASTKTAKPKKEKKLGINWFFWITLILIIIPCFYFVKLLHDASLESNVPVVGERLKHNIQNQITDEMVTTISTTVDNMENVELSETNLIVDTLRITLDVTDEMTADQMKRMVVDTYNKVVETAPVETYFSQHDDFKQYDLEINIYNNLDSENLIIVSLFRNSNMDNYTVQVLTSPVNKKVADELKIRMQEEIEERERERQEAEAEQNASETEETESEESGE